MFTTYNGFYWVGMNNNNVFSMEKQRVRKIFQFPFNGRFVILFKLKRKKQEKYNIKKLKKLSKYLSFRYEDNHGNEKKWDFKSQYNEIYAFDVLGKYIGTPEDTIQYYNEMKKEHNFGEIDS